MKIEKEEMVRLVLMRLVCFLFLLGGPTASIVLHAQITESQARQMLAQKNIPEDTLKARLLKKGYDIENLKPSQIDSFQKVLVETISEIEATQNGQKPEEHPIAEPEKIVEAPPPTVQPTVSPPASPPVIPDHKPTIYGQEIFRNNSIAVYKTASEAGIPDDYIIDAGDQIAVIGFGKSQFDQKLSVTNEGFVTLAPGLPKVLLKGLTWKDAKEVLYQRYSQYNSINRSEFQATLVQPRNMTINVFGEAKTTGAITLPGVNNAFNVITAAGGPTDIGSVRKIKIIRGKQVIPVDVYQFMNDPTVATNFYLRNNDYIHIPVAEKVVTINGAVIRPLSYELLENENLIQLIKYAGGTKPEAYLTDIQIARYTADHKSIINLNLRELKESGKDFELVNGDVIEIKNVEEATENIVSIQGAVSFPGKYENKAGMRISDLVKQSVLKPDARMDYAYLLRHQANGAYKYERFNLQSVLDQPKSDADVLLNNQDIIQVMTLGAYANRGSFSVEGAVKQPTVFTFDPEGTLKLEDAILMAGGLTQEADTKGYIIRHNPKEPKTLEYIFADFEKAISSPASAANLEILSGDVIRVFDKASRRDELNVSISGSVRNPGVYPFGANMTLMDLINLAGGMTFDADSNRIDIARASMISGQNSSVSQSTFTMDAARNQGGNSSTLQPFDQVYIRAIPEFELQQIVSISGEVKYPGNYALLKDKERIYDLIQRAGGLTGGAFPEGAKLYRHGDNTGLVVIDLKAVLANRGTVSNIILSAGDVLNIPKSRDLVTIEGYVNLDEAYSPTFLQGEGSISVAFRGVKSAKYYIDNFAAGVSEEGSLSKIKVQYADGRVESSKKILFFNSYPKANKGSHIIVGAKTIKPEKAAKEKTETDWSGVLRDTMAQATAVLTLLILVDQLSN